MKFRILGPLDVIDEGGASLPLGGLKQRALLAILLLHANEVVSSDQLIDELWGEEPPETAAHTVRVYVSRLRKALPREALVTKSGGYALQVRPGELDLERFEKLSERGRHELAAGDATAAARTLGEALGLWRGRALAEFAGEPFARVEADRLDELRLAALMDRIDADLAIGHPERQVAELDGLVATHPFRERLRGQLMLALYRSGRRADALSAYQDTRRRLVDELGLEPSLALQRLERAILAQEPSLERPAVVTLAEPPPALVRTPVSTGENATRASAGRPPRRRAILGAGSLAITLALAAVLGVLLREEDDSELRVPADSVAVIDSGSGEVTGRVSVGARPGSVVAGDGAVWVANLDDNSVSRIDPTTRRRVRTIGGDASPSGLALGFGSVWVANSDASSVSRIDPRFDRISRTIVFTGLEVQGVSAVAVGLGAVWGAAVSRAQVMQRASSVGSSQTGSTIQ